MRGQIYQWGQMVGGFPANAANDSVYKGIEGGWLAPWVILSRSHIDDEYNLIPGGGIAIAGIGADFVKTTPR